ncbi:glycosyltransferase family 39 protein [Pontibacter sp. G13]|uniref:ArnT family glycosyltransferase n=1 Tax=Pontibacter sp. G13 TaxID=3074898 RepID=UPI0028891BA2|nr:glycosyltransferase family 39 protein [Pontibacter sp. G13]WNJ16286.1 glycosyltransferase family 39 protein [Pontibacter sp. G13]
MGFQNRNLLYGGILLLSIWVFFANDWGYSIYIIDESRNAECAREMLEEGEWIVPSYNYHTRYDKPPLHYYFMMAGYSIFGVNPLGARFFSSLMGVILVMSVLWFSEKLLGLRSALLAAGTLLASLHLSVQYHLAVPDPYLITMMTIGILCFIYGLERNSIWAIYGIYLFLGLATLSKGPVALAIPGLIFLMYLLTTGQLNLTTLRKLRIPTGSLLYAAIAFPWYVLVGIETKGTWLKEFFFYHNVDRFSGPMEGHGGIFLIVPLIVWVGMLPASVFAIQAMRLGWKSRTQQPLLWLSFLVVAIIVGFFSISGTKLPNYAVPCYPFLAILIGAYLDKLWTEGVSKGDRISLWVLFAICVILPVGAYFGLKGTPHLAQFYGLSAWFLAMPICAGLGIWWLSREKMAAGLCALAAGFMIVGQAAHYHILPSIDSQTPLAIGTEYLYPNQTYGYLKNMNQALPFHLQEMVEPLDTTSCVPQFFHAYPDGYLVTQKRFTDSLLKYYPDLDLVFSHKDPFEGKTMMIFEADSAFFQANPVKKWRPKKPAMAKQPQLQEAG